MPSASFTYHHSLETTASAPALWRLYSDVSTWPRWDEAAERITLDGPFEVGSEGTMKFRGQDPLPFRLVEVDPEAGFVDETRVPDGLIRFRHRIEPLADGRVRLTHAVEIEGPEPFAQHLGPMITAGVPGTMDRLAELAQDHN